jgi:uncharacterized protein YjiS (DUF1127 family)
MPIHPTHAIAETRRCVAEPGHDLTHRRVTDLSADKDAAGPPATWTRRVLNFLKQCWLAGQEQREHRGRLVILERLSDRELQDIGVTRTEIEYIAAHRAIDKLRDRAVHPWMH